MTNTAASVIQNFYLDAKRDDKDAEKIKILNAAAALIYEDIKSCTSNKDLEYPTTDEMKCYETNRSFLPNSLKMFLNNLMPPAKDSIKMSAIGQAIMQAARPRSVLAPILLGLAVHTHHLTSSRELVDTLYDFGFSLSYSEALRYETNGANTSSAQIISGRKDCSNVFLQFVGDNVDHNIQTLDGRDTFHGMGMISIESPAQNNALPIKRDKPSLKEITQRVKIPIHQAIQPSKPMDGVVFKLDDLSNDKVANEFEDLVYLWKIGRSLTKCASFSSFMSSMLSSKDHTGVSGITFLPMINMPPTELTCVKSTLHFILQICKERKVTPVITFDQPLYFKAQTIIFAEPENSPLRDIVLRLGGFHTSMSFLASIGNIMAGSGLQEILEVFNAPRSVPHILSGKAYKRAIRGHTIVQAALYGLLLETASEIESGGQTQSIRTLKQEFTELVTDVKDGKIPADCIHEHKVLLDMKRLIESLSAELCTLSRTSSLWFVYIRMVDLLLTFTQAERTGDFILHLKCLRQMMPYLAAAGHLHYTKSSLIYLDQMKTLEFKNPEVYDAFKRGCHAIRRTDDYWAGLSTDLVIEQTLMRDIKSTGGLTRKRGFTDEQRTEELY